MVNILACSVLVVALLTTLIIGPLTPLTVIGFVPFCVILNRYKVTEAFAAIAPIALLPLFALASVLWSQAPDASLRYGLLYLITVIAGGLLGAALRPGELMKGLVLGLTVVGLISYPFGRSTLVGTSGEIAFMGLQGSKNAFGEVAGLSVIVSLAGAFYFRAQREYGWLALAVVGTLVAGLSLVLAKATGALLASIISSFCLLCWLVSIRMSKAVRNAIFVVTTGIVVILLALFDFWFPPLFEYVLDSTGKNVGLTGRSLLWKEADEQIASRPYFGSGYNAFWVHGNLEAERLWRALGIGARTGFNFHNTFREIMVDLGYVGLAFFGAIAIVSTAILGARALIAPTVPLLMALALMVYFSIKLPFETFGFGGMHLLSMMLYTCWAMGYASLWRALGR